MFPRRRPKEWPCKEVDPKRLEFLCPGANHQGIAALAAAHEYASVEDMLALAEERGEPPFLIVADELNDPHNLGSSFSVLRNVRALMG